METEKAIVLRDIKVTEGEYRWHYLKVILKENGDLFSDACDVCQAAKDFTGDSEYDYEITIKKNDLPILRKAFEIPEDKDILDFLLENYSGKKSFEFERQLKERNVPIDLFVW